MYAHHVLTQSYTGARLCSNDVLCRSRSYEVSLMLWLNMLVPSLYITSMELRALRVVIISNEEYRKKFGILMTNKVCLWLIFKYYCILACVQTQVARSPVATANATTIALANGAVAAVFTAGVNSNATVRVDGAGAVL
jgi:uncharacterized membrane protein